jgi:hypothetical protein
MTCGTDWVISLILPNFIEVLKVTQERLPQGLTEFCTEFHGEKLSLLKIPL